MLRGAGLYATLAACLIDATSLDQSALLRAGGGPRPTPVPGDPFVDFTSGEAARLGRWVLDTLLGAAGADWLIDALTRREPGCISRPGALVAFSLSGSLGPIDVGKVSFELGNLSLCGLDRLTRLDLLAPAPPEPRHTLGNALGFGVAPLTVGADTRLRVLGMGASIRDAFRFSLAATDLAVNVSVLARLRKDKLDALPLRERVEPGCLLAAVDRSPGAHGLRVPAAAVGAAQWAPAVACRSPGACSSPLGPALNHSLGTGAGRAEVTHVLNAALRYFLGAVDRPLARDYFQRMAENAKCPAPTKPPPTPSPPKAAPRKDPETAGHIALYTLVIGPILLAVLSAVLLTALAARRHGGFAALSWEASLCRSESVPPAGRYAIPAAIVVASTFFVTQSTHAGASLSVYVQLAGNVLRLVDLFDFDLTGSVTDMWTAHVYVLATLISLWSAAWLYVKIVMLIFSWVAPPEAMAPATRGRLLQALDFLNKWCFIDMFVLIMMQVAFRLHLEPGARTAAIPPNFLAADVIVIPVYAMYGFVLGAVINLSVNHAMVVWHRDAEANAAASGALVLPECDAKPLSPASAKLGSASHVTSRSTWFDVADDKQSVSLAALTGHCWWQQALVGVMLLGACVLCVLGCVMKSFTFELRGLAAILLEVTEPGSSRNSYSAVSLGTTMAKQGTNTFVGESDWDQKGIGNFFFAFVYLLFTVVAPLLQLLLLAVLWRAPLRLSAQKRLLFLNEVVSSWSCLEVFVVSIIAALTELPQFARFMLHGKCDGLNSLLERVAVPLGLLSEHNATCFDVKTTLETGCWVLFGGVVLVNIVFFVLRRMAEQGIHARERGAGL